jgi:hypothetical protein
MAPYGNHDTKRVNMVARPLLHILHPWRTSISYASDKKVDDEERLYIYQGGLHTADLILS